MPKLPAFRQPRLLGGGLLLALAALALTLTLPLAAQTITYTDGETNATAYDSSDHSYTLTIASGAATQSGNLTGDGFFYKTGAGTLTLIGTNTYTGGTTIAAGTLQLGNGGATGSIAGDVTNNDTLVFNRSDDFTFSGVISGPGSVINDGNILRFSAAQTFTGPLHINSGIVVLPTTVNAGLSPSTVVTVSSNGRLDLSGRDQRFAGLAGSGIVYSFGSPGSTLILDVPEQQSHEFAGSIGFFSDSQDFGLMKMGAGTQILSGANTYTGTTTIGNPDLRVSGLSYVGAGTLQIGNGGTTGSLNPASAIVNHATLIFDRSDTIAQGTDFGTISGPGRVIQRGGTVVLNSANTYIGGTIIEQGTLQIGTGGTTGSLVGPVANAGTVVFDRSDDYTFTGTISGSGGVVHNGGILRLAYAQYYTGPTVINSGTLVLTPAGDHGILRSEVMIATGARLDLSNRELILSGLTGGGTIYSFGGSAGHLKLDVARGQSYDFHGTLGGADPAFAFSKSGPGTFVLRGANTYTGATTLLGGTLSIDFDSVSANVLPSASSLVASGGKLALIGAGTQTLNGVTAVAGTANSIVLGANQTLNLGALTSAGTGSSLHFDTSAGGIVTFTGQTAGSVLSPGFTVLDSDGFGYATVNDFGQVVRFTTATDLLPASGALSSTAYTVDNIASDSNTAGSSTLALSASATTGAILVDTTADGGTLTLNSGVVLRNNSWNFRGEGSHAYTITGSGAGAGLRPVAAGDTVVINNYSSGLVTFASPILADGSNALVVNGTGTTVLSGASTYTGGTTVNGGTLQLGDGIQSLALGRPTGVWGANGYLSAGHDGADGGIAVAVNGNGSLTTLTGVTLTGGAGGAGGTGGTAEKRTVASNSEFRNLFNFEDGLRGGDGGSGGAGVSLETNGTVNVWKVTGGAGGNGGQGGTASLLEFVYSSFVASDDSARGGTGGTGGTGGAGLAVADGFAPALSGGTITGGAGGAGGPGGWGTYLAVTGTGGRGGDGGAGIIVGASATLDFHAVTGGKGGMGGAGGVFAELGGYGPFGPSGAGGTGGAGVIEFGGGTITVPASAAIAGGAGGEGFFGTTAAYDTGGSGDGGDGGSGGVGMLFSSGGTLSNRGTIAGGNGSAGGDATFVVNPSRPGVAGDGGDGGAGVAFEEGGTLTNSGTIRGGSGGAAGSARFAGIAGRAAPGVIFTGGAGTFTNQDGGIIHGGVSMENVANTVTLETGSQILGALSIGTHASSTLTLSGSGSATYSQAVTGATTFAGSLTKTGSGTWTLDRAFTSTGTTTVDEGTLLLTGSLGNTAVTVGAGASLGGEGSIDAGGSLTLNDGASLIFDGSTPGALFVGGDLTLNGTITVAMLSGTPGQPNRVLNYSGSLAGSAANFSTTHVRNPVFSTSTPNQIDLTFDAAKTLTWFGSTATWDVNSTANWDGGSEKFFQLDSVTFDDTGTTKHVLLATVVAPASTTFANGVGHDYTLTGSGSLSSEVLHNGDGNVTIGVLLGGTSSVTKSGAGTLTLTAANSYTGATTINGGTLQLGDGGTTGSLSPVSAITNDGTLVFNRSDTVTQGVHFADTIGGTGALVLQGGGTLVLTGSNTYTDGTTVSAGTLQIGNGGASGSLVGTVTNHDAVIFQRGDDYTFTGVVSGGGSLTHSGNTLRFSAGQNYTGPTRIDSGLLALSPTVDNGLSPLTVVTIASGASLDLAGRNQTLADIQGGGTIISSNSSGSSLTLPVGAGVSRQFSGTLGGSAPHFGLIKSGAGTQILTGTNTYTGGTTISGGTLQLGNGGATGSVTGSVENHGTLVFNRNNDYTFNGAVSGSGAVINNGYILRFSGAQTYTGPTQLNSGVLVLTSSADHGLSPSTVVTFAPGVGLDLSGRNQTLAGIEGGGSIYSFNSSGSTLTLDVGTGKSYAFSGSVGGAYPNFSLIKSGEGTQILSGANTHTGGTTISGGTLRIGNGGATGTIAGNITNDGTLEFSRTGDYVFSGIISGSGDFSTAGATLRFSAAHLYTGATRIESGILVLPTTLDNGLSSSTRVTVASGAKLDLSRRNQTLAGIEGGGEIYSFNSSGSTLTLDVGAGKSYAFTGNLGGADRNFGLTKSGSGIQTLSGASTYTGGTLVRAGALNLANTSGSALGTGSVTVESGAFLTGTGAFAGALTVATGGTLAPGDSAGLMTIGSGSIFNGTVALEIGGLLRGLEYDAIDVGGDGELTFGGTLAISLIDGFAPSSGDRFDLFNYTTATGTFSAFNLPELTAGLFWDDSELYTLGTLNVSGSAIPEPSSVALCLGLCALAAGLVRRRIRHPARTNSRG